MTRITRLPHALRFQILHAVRGPRALRLARLVLLLTFALLVSTPATALSDGRGVVNVTVQVAPMAGIEVTVSIQPDGEIATGRGFRVTAVALNSGETTLNDASATIHFDTTGITSRTSTTRSLPSLRPGQTRSAQWNLTGSEPGLFVITVEVTATDENGGVVRGEASRSTTIVEPARPGNRPN